MKSAVLLITSLLMLSLGPQLAYSADANGKYRNHGFGRITCQAINTKKVDLSKDVYGGAFSQWVSGFTTAYNTLVSDTYDILGKFTAKDLSKSVVNICAKKPESNVAAITTQLLLSNKAKRTIKYEKKK